MGYTSTFIILKDGVEFSSAERLLLEYAKENMSESMQPSRYSFIREFPLTPVGKVDFKKLEEMAAELEWN